MIITIFTNNMANILYIQFAIELRKNIPQSNDPSHKMKPLDHKEKPSELSYQR